MRSSGAASSRAPAPAPATPPAPSRAAHSRRASAPVMRLFCSSSSAGSCNPASDGGGCALPLLPPCPWPCPCAAHAVAEFISGKPDPDPNDAADDGDGGPAAPLSRVPARFVGSSPSRFSSERVVLRVVEASAALAAVMAALAAAAFPPPFPLPPLLLIPVGGLPASPCATAMAAAPPGVVAVMVVAAEGFPARFRSDALEALRGSRVSESSLRVRRVDAPGPPKACWYWAW